MLVCRGWLDDINSNVNKIKNNPTDVRPHPPSQRTVPVLAGDFSVFSLRQCSGLKNLINCEKNVFRPNSFFRPKGNGLIRRQVCDSRLKYWNCLILMMKMWTTSLGESFRLYFYSFLFMQMKRKTFCSEWHFLLRCAGGPSLYLKKLHEFSCPNIHLVMLQLNRPERILKFSLVLNLCQGHNSAQRYFALKEQQL